LFKKLSSPTKGSSQTLSIPYFISPRTGTHSPFYYTYKEASKRFALLRSQSSPSIERLISRY